MTSGQVTPGSRFRQLRVVGKRRESRSITSFDLEPVQPDGWQPFRPGQFLVFRLPGPQGPVLRNYSLSGSPGRSGRYRITVKREPAAPGFPTGLGSGYLHDQIAIGDLLEAEGPRGDFVLDEDSQRPVVLLAGGVGLTPLVAMLHRLAQSGDRRVLFLHAVDSGADHALRDEVLELCSRPGLTARFCYRQPVEADRQGNRFHAEGFVTKELLQSLLVLDDYDFYLCGPPPFMQACYAHLRAMGVPRARIAHEFFGPASHLEPAAPTADPVPQPLALASVGAATVEFRKTGISAAWDGSASLLDFAEAQGLAPEFSCRAGVCGTCVTWLVEGAVEYFEDPLDPPAAGQVLLCCARPDGAVVLDL